MQNPVIKVHYSLLFTLVLSCFLGQLVNAIGLIIVLLSHELGHIVFIKIFKVKIKKITFSLVGGFMDIDLNYVTPLKKSLIFCGWHS